MAYAQMLGHMIPIRMIVTRIYMMQNSYSMEKHMLSLIILYVVCHT